MDSSTSPGKKLELEAAPPTFVNFPALLTQRDDNRAEYACLYCCAPRQTLTCAALPRPGREGTGRALAGVGALVSEPCFLRLWDSLPDLPGSTKSSSVQLGPGCCSEA